MNPLHAAALGLATLLVVTTNAPDDFPRERGGANDEAKDALEGKTAPPLVVRDWMNSDALNLADLRGKVVLLKFWGVW